MSETMTQLEPEHFTQTFQAMPQRAFAGPARRGRGRPPAGERVVQMAAEAVPGSSSRTKNGCWSCRVRRKKCDEEAANQQGTCKQCARLGIECLGWGAKRPEWMRDKDKVAAWKADVTKTLTEKGMIRGVPRPNPPAPPPFTYAPSAVHAATPTDSSASPVSPTTTYIPGSGPIPSPPKPPPTRRQTSKLASVAPPPLPEPTGVVPSQSIPHESSDESDPDEFTFDDSLLMPDFNTLLDYESAPIGTQDALGPMEMNSIDINVNMNPIDSMVSPFGDFSQHDQFPEVEEVISDGVIQDNASSNYATFIPPSVVFGPITPYVQNGINAYGSYPSNAAFPQWSQPNAYPYGELPLSVTSTPYQHPVSPPMLRAPVVGIEQDRLRNMLILYYFKHVRQIQYVFAGHSTTNVMINHTHNDPDGAVSLALCSLAALHDSRMRIASELMPDDQRARQPADKYYKSALSQLRNNEQRFGRLTSADATAALHFVSFWLFAGGAGDWPGALEIAGDWYAQSNLATHENPMRALMEMDDNAKHASKTTMWMDIFSSISLCKSPRFLQLYRRLLTKLSPQTPGGPGLENVMGCSDSIMRCLAEIADLAHWKANEQQKGCLSVPDLVRRGLIIEKDLRQEGRAAREPRNAGPSLWGNLPPTVYPGRNGMDMPAMTSNMELPPQGGRLGQVPSLSTPPSSPPLPSAVGNGEELRRLVSDIFREAAILYLHTELSELRPNVPEIKQAVADTINALRKLPCSEYDRSLVFPLALAGCATDDPEMRKYVRARFENMRSAIGNCATVGQLIEHVWQRRDAEPGLVLSWRDAMAELDMTILLV